MKKTLLIISFSDISQDARVLKQVRLFRDDFRVVTCGEGPAPAGGTEHIRLPRSEEGLPASRAGRLLFGLLFSLLQLARAFPLAYWLAPQIRASRRLLHSRAFDAVLCNDVQPLPLLHRLLPLERVHADVHEYFPGMHDQEPRWRLLWRPYYRWMIRRYLPRVASVTTVTEAIARRYEHEFGIDGCGVVMNASPFQELEPGPVGDPIRIVHSGSALSNRRIENTMRAVAEAPEHLTLDLFLVPGEPSYYAELVQLAEELGERITVHPAVPQPDLVRTLNRYDVGISVLPTTNTNNVLALPNKFFDYIQARLGIVIGPSADMERILAEEDLGVVTADEYQDSIRRALSGLDRDTVARWKSNANACARTYSAEAVSGEWKRAVAALLG